jgi:cephalosporin-C deacetylase-like acetyl esterase
MKKIALGDSFSYSRRDTFRLAGLLGAAGLLPAQLRAQGSTDTPTLEQLNRLPRMVQEYFVRRVRRLSRQRLERLAQIKTRAHAQDYVDSVRERIAAAFGPMPEKTPLNARITGTVERDEYKIENVIFESRPGFLVTANLYIPKSRQTKMPGVVGTCGHSANGKAAETYQAFSQGLARQGYVVLIFDPIGQGERMQYVDADLKPQRGGGTREHIYAGNQQFLVNESFSTWRAWDGIRALDYLLTRDEVDPDHLGVTGNSGGGTATTWLCGVEHRWTMAAPSCFVTEFRRNLENELPADTEQCPPRVLALGLEHEDFIAAQAPKPVIILSKEKDYFDARGPEAAFQRLKGLYRHLGAEDQIALYIGPTYHGYSQENREAMYQWFNRATGVSALKKEPTITIEKDETLWCTPKGQIATLSAKPIYSFTRETSVALRRKRLTLDGPGLRRTVADTLRLSKLGPTPEYRILRPHRNRNFPLEHAITYLVETEPGIQAAVYRLSKEPLYSRPPRDKKRAILYVSHLSSDAELRDEPLIRELLSAEPDSALFTCDVRGIGDSQPNTTNPDSFRNPYGSDYFYSIHSIMLDAPYLGQRTHDVRRVLQWLGAVGHTEVHLVGRGWGAIPAAFAALEAGNVIQVTLKNALTSYTEVAEAKDYNWPLSILVPGILRYFDLPEVYAELEQKQLKLVEPWGANPKDA